jgi:sortase B
MKKPDKYAILKAAKVLFGVSFLVMCAGACYLACVEHWENQKIEALSAIHEQQLESVQTVSDGTDEIDDSASISFAQLAEINEDYLGWLTVGGSVVNLPVVLGTDNDFYLKHDFYGKKSKYGTLFADYLTQRGQEGNLLIYGHNMKNESMFGNLTFYGDLEFFENHEQILWETEDDTSLYEVFAVLVVPGDEQDPEYLPIRDYLGQISAEKQEMLLDELQSRARIWHNIQVSGEDRLLFLITCDYTKNNGRLLLCAKWVESRE